jgi:hypothetical protein
LSFFALTFYDQIQCVVATKNDDWLDITEVVEHDKEWRGMRGENEFLTPWESISILDIS